MSTPLQLKQPELVLPTSVSGSGVDTTDGTTANTISAGTITSGVYAPGTISATQDTPGAAFSFSATYTQADAVPTSAATVGAVQNFGSMTSNAAGAAGDLAGTITSAGAMTLTAGGLVLKRQDNS